MAKIREEVTIFAPSERVWHAVHEDLANLPRWTRYLKRATLIDGSEPGPGRRVRYDLDLPGEFSLTLLPTVWDRPRHCAGKFAGGTIEGTWSYTYEERDGATRLTYEMDYHLGGLLRLAGGLLQSRYENGIRQGMQMLKEYLESEGDKQ
jgi:uncharacterized membrane protein